MSRKMETSLDMQGQEILNPVIHKVDAANISSVLSKEAQIAYDKDSDTGRMKYKDRNGAIRKLLTDLDVPQTESLAAKIEKTASQTAAANTQITLAYASAKYDENVFFDPASPSKAQIKTQGKYNFVAQIPFTTTIANIGVSVIIRKNGTEEIGRNIKTLVLGSDVIQVAASDQFQVNDYVEVLVQNNSATSLTVAGSATQNFLVASRSTARGKDAFPITVKSTIEAPGINLALGGVKLEIGQDTTGDGLPDTNVQTIYLSKGPAGGSGVSAPVKFAQAITTSPTTVNSNDNVKSIVFQGEQQDTSSFFAPVSNILTVPEDGFYHIGLKGTYSGATNKSFSFWAEDPTGDRICAYHKEYDNDAGLTGNQDADEIQKISVSGGKYLTAGTLVKIYAQVDSFQAPATAAANITLSNLMVTIVKAAGGGADGDSYSITAENSVEGGQFNYETRYQVLKLTIGKDADKDGIPDTNVLEKKLYGFVNGVYSNSTHTISLSSKIFMFAEKFPPGSLPFNTRTGIRAVGNTNSGYMEGIVNGLIYDANGMIEGVNMEPQVLVGAGLSYSQWGLYVAGSPGSTGPQGPAGAPGPQGAKGDTGDIARVTASGTNNQVAPGTNGQDIAFQITGVFPTGLNNGQRVRAAYANDKTIWVEGYISSLNSNVVIRQDLSNGPAQPIGSLFLLSIAGEPGQVGPAGPTGGAGPTGPQGPSGISASGIPALFDVTTQRITYVFPTAVSLVGTGSYVYINTSSGNLATPAGNVTATFYKNGTSIGSKLISAQKEDFTIPAANFAQGDRIDIVLNAAVPFGNQLSISIF